MRPETARQIVKGAFRTVYPNKNFRQIAERHRRKYRAEQKKFLNRSNEDYNKALVEVVFYSGFRAKTATSYMKDILKVLGDPRKSADYSKKDVAHILKSDRMIKNRQKILACIENARTLLKIDEEYGSINEYFRSFGGHVPKDDDAISRLLQDLKKRFHFIGPRTGRHLLLKIGFPMIKPDIMVMRVLSRLGLVNGESDEYIDDAVHVCLEMAELACITPAFIDELLVKVGQSEGAAVCRKTRPLCYKCGLGQYCGYQRWPLLRSRCEKRVKI